MYVPIIDRCQNPQSAVLLQITPLCQLEPEGLALLEAVSENHLATEDALYDIYGGNRANCLTFIDCNKALVLLEALAAFEQGRSLEDLLEA